jgi:ribose transport system permease protein
MKITGTKRDDLSPPLGETTLAEPTAGGAIGQFLQRYGVIIAWVAIFGFFSAMRSSTFPRLSTLQLIFGTQSVILITAIGLVFSLAVGEYDLSVGSLVGLGSTLLAVLSGRHHWPVVAAIVVTLVICFLVGCVNALLSVYLGVQSIIITLGTGTLIAGLTLAVSGSVVVTGVPIGFTNLLTHQIIGLAMPFWLGLVLTIVTWFILQHMPLGRRMIFVQENREVARLAGLRVNRIRAGGLIATSTIAGLAGIMLAGLSQAADPQSGASFLLPAFAAAFLGSTAIVPGRFNAVGTFAAVYFLVTGITGLDYLGYAGWPGQVFYGGSLVVAVSLSHLAGRRLA